MHYEPLMSDLKVDEIYEVEIHLNFIDFLWRKHQSCTYCEIERLLRLSNGLHEHVV